MRSACTKAETWRIKFYPLALIQMSSDIIQKARAKKLIEELDKIIDLINRHKSEIDSDEFEEACEGGIKNIEAAITILREDF